MGEDAYESEGPGYVAGALAGGLPLGVVGACCCSLFAPLLGALSARVASGRTPWFGVQEGVLAGSCAGAIGWLVQAAISVPLQVITPKIYASNPVLTQQLPPFLREAALQEPSVAMLVGVNTFLLFVYVGGAAFGGGLAGHFFLRKEPRQRKEPLG